MKRGSSLIDVIIALGIIVILFGGIYLVYISLISSLNSIELRSAAASVLAEEAEAVRTMPYDSIGTAGGIPSGAIPQQQSIPYGNYAFTVATVVRSIDDPFDGTLGGNPNDTAPADYKIVEFTATCPLCQRFTPMVLTTFVAPKNLESAGLNGSLFIYVKDANGNGVGGETVRVVNTNVTPTVNLTDTTNNSGTLQLVGVPTSTQSYQVYVSRAGYSSDQTYPLGAPSNPNPRVPYATVGQQQLTSVTLYSDKTSQLTVLSSNDVCAPVPSEPFSIHGDWLIGTGPDVLNFSTSTQTSTSGQKIFSALRWDTYTLALNDASEDVAGTTPFSPDTVNPGTSSTFRFVVQPAQTPSLLVSVEGVSGNAISGAAMKLSSGGFSKTLLAGHHVLNQTDWSGGALGNSSGIDASTPGDFTLRAGASSTYSTSTPGWLISNTFDVGGASSTFYTLQWSPVSQPPSTGPQSVEFQVAANNDNATWNFVGPDGMAASYFTASGSSLNGVIDGNRYFRYKVYLSTQDENASPEVDSVSVEFNGVCVPPSQVLFTSVPAGNYTLDATAAGYAETTSSVTVGAGWQQATVVMP